MTLKWLCKHRNTSFNCKNIKRAHNSYKPSTNSNPTSHRLFIYWLIVHSNCRSMMNVKIMLSSIKMGKITSKMRR